MDYTEAVQIFEGVMLGDGGLRYRGGSAHLEVHLSGKGPLSWLHLIKNSLEALNVKVCAEHPRIYWRTSKGKLYEECILHSKESLFLTQQYHRWYGTGKKEVPEDLVLTPVSLAHWFMGDGSSRWNNPQRNCWHGVQIRLATNAFGLKSIEKLRTCLTRLSIIDTFCSKTSSGIVLYVSGNSSLIFTNLVEPHVLEHFKYKIKRPKTAEEYIGLKTEASAIAFKELRMKLSQMRII